MSLEFFPVIKLNSCIEMRKEIPEHVTLLIMLLEMCNGFRSIAEFLPLREFVIP